LVLTLALAAACGDAAVIDDGGADVGADALVDVFAPTPPAPPAPPVLTPCPEGWLEVGEAPAIGCAPWSLETPPACEGAQAHFPGQSGCTALGTECPSDGWPTDAPVDAVFVRAGAVAGGDGTRDAPYSDISAALASLTAGAPVTIAIATGDYDEPVEVPADVTLLGACVSATVLHTDEARFDRGVITAVGTGVVVSNLSISRSERGGVWAVGATSSVMLRDVLIEEVLIAGVDAEAGAAVVAERLVVRRVRSTALSQFGRGLTIESGASAIVRQLFVEDCVEFGVLSFGEGTTVSLEDAALLDTEPLPTGVAGAGLVAMRGGRLDALRLVVDRATDAAVVVAGGTATVRDANIRGTRSRPDEGDRGRAVSVQGGGSLVLERVSLEDNREFGIVGAEAMTRIEARDVIVRRTRPSESEGIFGRALSIQTGASLVVDRAFVERSHEAAVYVSGPPATDATLRDVTIVDTHLGERLMTTGRGISVQNRGRLIAERIQIERAVEAGIFVGGLGAHAEIDDMLIRDVEPTPTHLQPSGRGIIAQLGGNVVLDRAEISNVNDVGIAAFDGESLVSGVDVVLDSVASVTCISPICAVGGHGAASYGASRIELDRFRISSPEVCGVHVALGGRALLSTGLVEGASIGACVQSDAQVLSDLQMGVRYQDNATPLDTTMLAVPAVPDAL